MSAKQTVVAWSVVAVLAAGLAGTTTVSVVQTAGRNAADSALVRQSADLKTARSDRDAAKAQAVVCAASSELWRKAAAAEATAVSTWLDGLFSGRQLDLTEAQSYISQAKAAGCVGGDAS